MVQKIRITILFVIIALLSVCALTLKGGVETNLLRTILPSNISDVNEIVSIADKSASVVRVVFESADEEQLEKTKERFLNGLDKTCFEPNKPDVQPLISKYLTSPSNFLSDEARNLLINEKYDEVCKKSIESLYNPATVQITRVDKDPFLLLDDFLLSLRKTNENYYGDEGKVYDYLTLRLKGGIGLSPDLSNKSVSALVKLSKSDKSSKIYLAGTPVHSYYTSRNSVIAINTICIISTLLILFLTFYYFGSLSPILPMGISIIVGLLSGYISTKLWFDNFQIITMVFSTGLIGIGIDYSYHYFFAKEHDNQFYKNLTAGFITTVLPFIILYLTGIEILEQISVFTVFGLLGIYLTVVLFYPCFKPALQTKFIQYPQNKIKPILVILLILGCLGYLRLNFNDSLSALYSPTKRLKTAETLFNKVSGSEDLTTRFISVRGKDLGEVLLREEEICDKLAKSGVDYISLSKFIPSERKQYESFVLVKKLYSKELKKYSDILSKTQLQTLYNEQFSGVSFDIKSYPFLSDFLLNDNTSLIFVFDNKPLVIESDNAKVVNLQSSVAKYLKDYRSVLIKVLFISVLFMLLVLSFFFGVKKSFKLLLPSVCAIFASVGLTLLIVGELNLFSIIAVFMMIGFTIDYSVFRANSKTGCEDAIFVSALTTSVSFLLLALSGFRLISSISVILFLGIIVSYIAGKIIFDKSFES